MRICALLKRSHGFRRRDELRNEFRGKVPGGGGVVEKGYRRSGLLPTIVAARSNESSPLSSFLAGNGPPLLQLL